MVLSACSQENTAELPPKLPFFAKIAKRKKKKKIKKISPTKGRKTARFFRFSKKKKKQKGKKNFGKYCVTSRHENYKNKRGRYI